MFHVLLVCVVSVLWIVSLANSYPSPELIWMLDILVLTSSGMELCKNIWPRWGEWWEANLCANGGGRGGIGETTALMSTKQGYHHTGSSNSACLLTLLHSLQDEGLVKPAGVGVDRLLWGQFIWQLGIQKIVLKYEGWKKHLLPGLLVIFFLCCLNTAILVVYPGSF